MVPFRVKICGITSSDDALLAAEAGADAIGLNFYSQSPRCVSPDQAEEIVTRLREEYSPAQVQVVGVFVNHSLDEILWAIRDASLFADGICLQLHGDEPPELLRDLRAHGLGAAGHLLQATGHVPTVPIIRAFRCREAELTAEKAYLAACEEFGASPQAVLLDGWQAGAYGGTGKALDWESLGRQRNCLGLPVILAGGLTPTNVAAAIAAVRPRAVDVASGVESAPGKKDYAKTMAFVAAARQAFKQADQIE
jgi:phosphoribosylanthranilate isomerase